MKNSTTSIRTFIAGLALAAIILTAGAGSAMAQRSAHDDAKASAKIVSGLSLEKERDLNFGSIVRTTTGGTVTVNATTGAISYSGVSQGQTRNYQTASFETSGEPEYLYTITLPRSAELTKKNGHATMTVVNFTHSEGAGHLDREGKQDFTVGGTLQVGPNQETGEYEGSFEVTVEYQ